MSDPSQEALRAEFEAWWIGPARRLIGELQRSELRADMYCYGETQIAWHAYQAARASADADRRDAALREPTGKMLDLGEQVMQRGAMNNYKLVADIWRVMYDAALNHKDEG